MSYENGSGVVQSGYTGVVSFSSSDSHATLPGASTLVNGVGTFVAKFGTLGVQTLTATDTVTSAVTGSTTVSVTSGQVAKFVVSAPASTTAGTAFTVVVTAEDSGSNIATTYTGTIDFTTTDPATMPPLALPANYTFTQTDGGVHTFTLGATLITAGLQTVTVADTVATTATGSATVTVSPAAASQFVLSAPTPETAGVPFGVSITAKDTYGNIATGYTGTVHITSTDPQAQLPNNFTFANGSDIFSVTLETANNLQTVTATDASNSLLNGTSNQISVVPGAATHFSVSSSSTTTVAGTPFSVTVVALDAFGNIVKTYGGTVHFTSSDPKAALPPDGTLTNSGGGIFTVTLKTVGATGIQSITATDISNSSITGSTTVSVTAGAATKLSIVAPVSAVSGTPFSFTVDALDTFGNIATGYTGSVGFTSTASSSTLPTPAQTLTGGIGIFNATLNSTGNQTITGTDSVTSSIVGTSNVISVTTTASKFNITGLPSTVVAGTPETITVTAADSNNNTATGYTGTVHFTSTDLIAGLPNNYTFTLADNGVHVFTTGVTLKTAGTQTVTATDTATTSITGSETASVTPSGAAQFGVSAPSTATAGVGFNVTVTAEDQFGNAVGAAYTGTVHFSTTAPSNTLPANKTLTGGSGIFSVTLKSAGTFTVSANDVATTSIVGTSGNITVSAGATSQFAVTGSPTTIAAGQSTNFTVTAEDSFGNPTGAAYTGTVNFSISNNAGTPPASRMLSSGVGVFSGIVLTKSGTQTLTATDSVNPLINGQSNGISVTALAATHYSVVGSPTSVTAGTTVSFTVTALDTFGNVATGYTGTVGFTVSNNAGTAPANSALVGGVGTFNVALTKVGNQTLTATDTSTSITGVSNAITVSPGLATHYTVSAPGTAQAGVSFPFTVTALDSFGNVATGYAGTVLTTTSDLAVLNGPSGTLTNGTGTFNITLVTPQVTTITATDSINTGITGNTTVTVASSFLAANHFSITAPSSPVQAGSAFTYTVTALAANNTVAGGYTGTVDFTTSDAHGTFAPSSYTFTAADTGVHVFTLGATLVTLGTQTITATDTTAAPTITGSTTVSVLAGAATHYTVTAPSTAVAGTPFNFTVTALDTFNNVASGYTGIVTFTTTDPLVPTLPNATLTSGVGTFSATLEKVQVTTITATDTTTTSITGTSGGITVSPGVATQYVLSAVPPTVTAGTPTTFTVTAEDTYGNVATGYTGTVKISSTSASVGTLPSSTLTNGVGTFTVTLTTAGRKR